jgi:hypothetical protein
MTENGKRTCWNCYWHYWERNRCSQSGQIIFGDSRDRVCRKHETIEEYHQRLDARLKEMALEEIKKGLKA